MELKRSWSRVFVEGLVIVVSILLAFSIDAWWERHQEAALERHYLQQLDEDLAQMIQELEGYVDFTAERIDAAYQAYDILSGASRDIQDAQLSVLLSLATQRRTIELKDPAYTQMVSSGNLGLIRNPDLRSRIVRFYETTQVDYEVLEKNDAVYVDGLAVDAVFGRGVVRGSFPNHTTDFDSRGYREPRDRAWSLPMGTEDEEVARLRSALWMRAGAGGFAIDNYAKSIIARAETLQRLVTAELDRRWESG